jgi:16S rRNA (uracil1498-N3)-methyltransferase
MHRCYLESARWKGGELRLSSDESHHLLKVLRAEQGDEVFVFDGAGHSARARLDKLDPVTLSVLEETVAEDSRVGGITLIQALPKGKRMDLIVEKATELGVSTIVPVITERVVAIPKADRVERWRRIVVSAAKQCGASNMPSVLDIMDYGAAIDACGPFDLLLVGSLAPDTKLLKDVLRDSEYQSVAVIIGPEGDLTQGELDDAIAKGAVPVSFGELVLRVETAALYVISAIRYEA